MRLPATAAAAAAAKNKRMHADRGVTGQATVQWWILNRCVIRYKVTALERGICPGGQPESRLT